MKVYDAAHIKNIAIVGHGGDGKTTLAEAFLANAGLIERRGRVEDGNTTTDYDPEEARRQISLTAAMAPVEWRDVKLNFIDAPGFFDFVGAVSYTHLDVYKRQEFGRDVYQESGTVSGEVYPHFPGNCGDFAGSGIYGDLSQSRMQHASEHSDGHAARNALRGHGGIWAPDEQADEKRRKDAGKKLEEKNNGRGNADSFARFSGNHCGLGGRDTGIFPPHELSVAAAGREGEAS